MSQKTQSFFVRFAKGFIAGGIGAIALQIHSGVSFSSLGEAQAIVNTLLGAFLTGGLLAVEKMLTWQETLQ